MRRFQLALAAVVLSVAGLAAQEPGAGPMSEIFEGLRQEVGRFSSDFRSYGGLPQPDRATLDYLASRIPGLAVEKVRLVAPDVAVSVLQKAADQKLTYLQFLTGDAFKGDLIYYAPQDAIAAVEKKFITGTLPFSGTTSEGKPFRMIGFVGGQGHLHYLYDVQDDFTFNDPLADRNFKIQNQGHVEAQIAGTADLSIQGFGVEAFAGMFTDIQRITQTSASRIRVTTGMGSGDGDISPIRAK